MCYNGPREVITVRIHTERKRPTPAKMRLAGENTWDMYKRAHLREVDVLKHTKPTLASRMSEKADKTLTVGSSHFVHRPSVLRG